MILYVTEVVVLVVVYVVVKFKFCFRRKYLLFF